MTVPVCQPVQREVCVDNPVENCVTVNPPVQTTQAPVVLPPPTRTAYRQKCRQVPKQACQLVPVETCEEVKGQSDFLLLYNKIHFVYFFLFSTDFY